MLRLTGRCGYRKAQYEAKLKFWGMLKNLTPEQWEAVHRRMERRKAANKKTYLILGGRILPEEKIRKATSRYCVGLSMNHMFRGKSLPDSLYLAWPGSNFATLVTFSSKPFSGSLTPGQATHAASTPRSPTINPAMGFHTTPLANLSRWGSFP